MQTTTNEVAVLLRRLAEAIEANKSVVLRLAGENVLVPSNADVKLEYKSGEEKEVNIGLRWDGESLAPQLIRRHSEQVRDSFGHVYDVLIYGEAGSTGTWEGWLEFVPLDGAVGSRRTSRETTQPDRVALEYWATGLQPLYLLGAFERAS
ncbi:MAG TPA: amphi-Trp domain-containing protein [Pyrinomonadaceae bacterium]|nr:amphi-Trp domain-containing protein [Pyrinomonadaceae bacterium]